jgi:formyltetrahydrofolate deformylase
MGDTYILLIDCDDQKGLVHKITGALFRRDLNIISNHEFVDRGSDHFFMRTEFAGEFDAGGLTADLHGLLPAGVNITLSEKRKKNIVIMVSREHHCLGDLIMRHEYNRLNASILAVVSNHEYLKPLVDKFGIPYHCITHENRSRERHEEEIAATLEKYRPEYIVLAKYMRIFTEGFVRRFADRIINIHHSFLPAFVGANPYRQAYERGVKIIGATAHFVNGSLDEGPIIAQNVITVDHTHSAEDMMEAGKDVEKTVLAKALKLAFEDRIFVNGNKTIIFD